MVSEESIQALAQMKIKARLRDEESRQKFLDMAASQNLNPFEFQLSTGGHDDYYAIESPDDL